MKKSKSVNKLAFTKASVAELNNDQLYIVNGGSCSGCICDAVVDAIVEVTKDFTRPIIK
ncbi:class I lanthipeptide [Flavobacterium amniphilum]|uniref:class I lanthipeptide n=1 Tax=Flavobacterium amniphilum TaxID=1834035 RepID=UPI002029E7D4|nr:class I lanthipeptide [Flavobacterium amniphilum]MCL9807399.1 class I lanthipeptide [Flavobacterium amniphilum]